MNYLNDVFKRMNLNQIRSFILCGAEDFTVVEESYRDTLQNESNPIYRRLENLYTDNAERDIVTAELSQALLAYECVYMDLGMKAGARLLWQLLLSDNPLPLERSEL